MGTLEWRNTRVRLGDLQPWERNPREMTKQQAQRLLASLREFGLVHSIAIGPNGEVYDGHQRLSALLALYGPDFEVDARQSNRPLTEDERERLVITLHAGAFGRWNWEELANWPTETLVTAGFDHHTLDAWEQDTRALRKMLAAAQMAFSGEADVVPELEEAAELATKWGVQPGQLWRIPSQTGQGEHVILCGDSRRAEDVALAMGGEKATLLFTDPPYGVNIAGKARELHELEPNRPIHADIPGDNLTRDQLHEYLSAAFLNAKQVLADDAAVFVCGPSGGDLGRFMLNLLADVGLMVRHILVWDKGSPTFSVGRLDYAYQHEPIFFTWMKRHKKRRQGIFQTSVWNVERPARNPYHATIKPTALYENAILNHTDPGDIVLDIFAGTGTVMVAAETHGRRAVAIELVPEFVAVALERAAQMGLEPRMETR